MTTNYENFLWKENLYIGVALEGLVHMLFVNTFLAKKA